MNRFVLRALAASASFTCAAAGAATPPVRIDTEQKAAAAFITALHTSFETPLHHSGAIERVVFYTNRALQKAASVTTPAALMAASAGINVPCETSGSITVRLTRTIPRVFKYEWKDCHFPLDGWPATLDGPGEVVLLSDSFTPDKVAAIRFGSASRELASSRDITFPDFSNRDVTLRNLRVVGVIPMNISQFAVANSVAAFTYVMAGFVDETQTSESTGSPTSSTRYLTEFDGLALTGSFVYNGDATRHTEDLRALFGTLTYTRTDPPPYGVSVEKFHYDDFHVRDVTDFNALDRTHTVDGRVDFTWNPNFGAGCISGGYAFKTRVPLHRSLTGLQPYDAGDLNINGNERVRLFSAATVPPSLPSPVQNTLIHIDLTGVGVFNYDVAEITTGLHPISGCM